MQQLTIFNISLVYMKKSKTTSRAAQIKKLSKDLDDALFQIFDIINDLQVLGIDTTSCSENDSDKSTLAGMGFKPASLAERKRYINGLIKSLREDEEGNEYNKKRMKGLLAIQAKQNKLKK